MKFEDIKGNTKLHIGCKREYLPDWINVNTVVEDVDVECDATWDLSSIVYWKKNSIDVIYVENFLTDLQRIGEQVDMMLATYKHVLKKDGLLILGLEISGYESQIVPWIKKLGFNRVIYFDVADVNNKKFISVS